MMGFGKGSASTHTSTTTWWPYQCRPHDASLTYFSLLSQVVLSQASCARKQRTLKYYSSHGRTSCTKKPSLVECFLSQKDDRVSLAVFVLPSATPLNNLEGPST
mmetsp:Transcript_34663/g.51472  ORF Transcript_34663/g.51472 Transcript_34663/m.51472 type:complete len:104 (-) Transcript_34663:236-547(-)